MIPAKAALPTLANITLLPRRRLRDGTQSQTGEITPSSDTPRPTRGSRASTSAAGSSRASSSSRSSTRGGTPVSLRRVQRLRGGAVGGGRNKEDAVEVGDSDEDVEGDGVEVIDVDSADVTASFASPKPKRARRDRQEGTNRASGSKQTSTSANNASAPRISAPIPDPSHLPTTFRSYAESWHATRAETRLWSLTSLFSPPSKSDVKGKGRYGMIILNQPITRDDVFRRAWDASLLRVCADGGANRLFDHLEESERERFLPDLIKGDLDSIRPDVREYYASRGVEVKQDQDEYSTDLMKCITEIEEREASLTAGQDEQVPIILMGGLSGRVDQTVHTMSLLHKLRTRRSEVYVLNGESVAWVLDEGSHLVDIDHTTMGQTCGILPVGVDSSIVKTQGLKWDLDGKTSMDGLLSTSNHLLPQNPAVWLETSRPVLWCIEIKEPLPVQTVDSALGGEKSKDV